MAMLRAMPVSAPLPPMVKEKGMPIKVTTKAMRGYENLRLELD